MDAERQSPESARGPGGAPTRSCPRCDGEIAPDAPLGLCPRCLIARVLDRGGRGSAERDAREDEARAEDTEEAAAPESASAPPRPGRATIRFGEYELFELLGEGGMGVVYRARQVRADRVVALKMLLGGPFAGEAAARKFQDEIEAVARLDHPHIVPIYDVGEHEGRPYFTMKLMAGGTLADRLAREEREGEGYRDARRAAELLATLARAVHEGHRRHILHRDLKPENILFDDAGRVYVGDFGVAKHLHREGDTQTGAVVGSAGYMAPEQALGHAKRVTPAADVWSLGVVLYEMLAGRRPFDGPTPVEALRRAVEEEPAQPRSLRRDLPRDLETICLTCLRKDPARRYASAEALAADLDRFLRGEPIEARRPGPLERAARWAPRHPVAVVLLAVAALALLGAIEAADAQQQARRLEVRGGNIYAARAVAGTVLAQIREYGEAVAEAAEDREAAALVERGDGAALEAFCRAAYPARGCAGSPFPTWFVLDREGTALAHWPPLPSGYVGRSYRWREYFEGAARLAASSGRALHVSRAFVAEVDGHFKIGLSAPIRAPSGGGFVGVLVATMAADSKLGAIQLSDGRRVAALAVRRDREREGPTPAANDYVLLVRDGVAYGKGIPFSSDLLPRLHGAAPDPFLLAPPDRVAFDDAFVDPLDPAQRGKAWIAGFAPVGHTDLVVIVETRLEDAIALDPDPRLRLAIWGGVPLGLFLLGVAATAARRRAARQKADAA